MDWINQASSYWEDRGVPPDAFLIALGVTAVLFFLSGRSKSFPLWPVMMTLGIIVAAFFAPLVGVVVKCAFFDC
jgi:hypothetical protein